MQVHYLIFTKYVIDKPRYDWLLSLVYITQYNGTRIKEYIPNDFVSQTHGMLQDFRKAWVLSSFSKVEQYQNGLDHSL